MRAGPAKGDRMKYLEAQRLAERQAREAEDEEPEAEAKMDTGAVANKAVTEGPANKGAEKWPFRMDPEQYIALNADSQTPAVQEKVALARRIVGAEA